MNALSTDTCVECGKPLGDDPYWPWCEELAAAGFICGICAPLRSPGDWQGAMAEADEALAELRAACVEFIAEAER